MSRNYMKLMKSGQINEVVLLIKHYIIFTHIVLPILYFIFMQVYHSEIPM